ncbi:uncharacterized protein BDZ99DRAFT_516655 [Mytilinidion resinicola]|uniref:Uncharacterized protein n=1 Tax=Mytilinidion resinicola TaxID=574789 RepID=A0A6A6YYY1_9PEZI|nr:uncharacterized protein BDZ99DRAFT_516655 [Mytilinidion resinicola]KAF2814031.1 hypothetical protein BDZ99DRAFT_516655 [Mytilinidion resinicola]
MYKTIAHVPLTPRICELFELTERGLPSVQPKRSKSEINASRGFPKDLETRYSCKSSVLLKEMSYNDYHLKTRIKWPSTAFCQSQTSSFTWISKLKESRSHIYTGNVFYSVWTSCKAALDFLKTLPEHSGLKIKSFYIPSRAATTSEGDNMCFHEQLCKFIPAEMQLEDVTIGVPNDLDDAGDGNNNSTNGSASMLLPD